MILQIKRFYLFLICWIWFCAEEKYLKTEFSQRLAVGKIISFDYEHINFFDAI